MLNMVRSMNPGHWMLILLIFISSQSSCFARTATTYFQLKVYHFQTTEQEQVIDRFLEKAYLPAMHRLGFKEIAIFKPIDNKDKADKLVYVFSSSANLEKYANLDVDILKDKRYQASGKEYLEAAYNHPPYSRIETILMKAFEGMPLLSLPKLSSDKSERVYELRSYEAPTEKLSANKISMFNNGEIDIFKKLNFNAVFYDQVIAGSTMPNLIYLTTFENMTERDAHWKAFGPLYKPMADLPQYQNNVSKNVTTLCRPTDYSDI
ncbi:hypothetical protein D3C79_357670 [compost metagenome]